MTVLWRFAAARVASERAERRAQRLIGASFFLIAVYVAAEAIHTLAGGSEPEVSYAGIALAAVTLAIMPPLALAAVAVREGREAWRGEDACCAH